MEISETKTKKVAMCGNNIVRAKIELDGKVIEQVSEFKHLGSIISNYNAEWDLEYRRQSFNKVNGVIRRKMEEESRRQICMGYHSEGGTG
jgi:hypothetical protein